MTPIPAFSLSRLPRIEYGDGGFSRVPALLARFGAHPLIVTGSQSFCQTVQWETLASTLTARGVRWETWQVHGEPSPQEIDAAVSALRRTGIDVVLGVGGGSVLDAAKAIAGLLEPGNSVMDHLEGVGLELPYRGPATPFIAVPTTAGAGSEATQNAVLSVQGENGYKKSFRDERLTAEYAVIDPELMAGCPPSLIAANGMDALTQLLESFVSIRANPFTDALALDGIRRVSDGLLAWVGGRRSASGGGTAGNGLRRVVVWRHFGASGTGRGAWPRRAVGGVVSHSPRRGLQRTGGGRHPDEYRLHGSPRSGESRPRKIRATGAAVPWPQSRGRCGRARLSGAYAHAMEHAAGIAASFPFRRDRGRSGSRCRPAPGQQHENQSDGPNQ